MTQYWVEMRKKWENAAKDKINSGFCSLIFLLNSIMSFCQKDITTTPFRGVNFGQLEVVAILYFLPIYCNINFSDPSEFIYYTWPFVHKRQKAMQGFFYLHPIQVWKYLKEQIRKTSGTQNWEIPGLSFLKPLKIAILNTTKGEGIKLYCL